MLEKREFWKEIGKAQRRGPQREREKKRGEEPLFSSYLSVAGEDSAVCGAINLAWHVAASDNSSTTLTRGEKGGQTSVTVSPSLSLSQSFVRVLLPPPHLPLPRQLALLSYSLFFYFF